MNVVFQSGLGSLVFQYLDTMDVVKVMGVNKAYYMCATLDEVWSEVCEVLFPYTQVKSGCFAYFQTHKSTFFDLAEHLHALLGYLDIHAQNTRMISSFTSVANPLVKAIYRKFECSGDGYLQAFDAQEPAPHTLESVARCIRTDFEKQWNCDMPLELYYFYLLHNGQEASRFVPSLLGSYKYNHIFVNPVFLPYFQPRDYSSHFYQIGACPHSQLQVLVDVTNCLGRGNSSICLSTGIMSTVLYQAPSLSSLFRDVLVKLSTGVTELNDVLLDAFENNECASTAVTEGICIQARSQFVPHQSDLHQYLWAYEIRISPASPSKRWRLVSRRWEIEDVSGYKNTVEGSGVVGLYPQVFKGSETVIYESCCMLQATEGWMQGWFKFENMDRSSEFLQATVSRFHLKLPTNAELLHIQKPRTNSLQ